MSTNGIRMFNKKTLLGILLLGISTATSAMAADLPPVYKAPAAAPGYNWTGCYVGGNGGGGRSNNDWSPFNSIALGTVHSSGWFGGVQGGCDYQAGPWVFGVGGQFDWAD